MSEDEEDFLGFGEEEVARPSIEILKTSRNKDLLVLNGFIFYANRKPVDDVHYWECKYRTHSDRYTGTKCGARAVTRKRGETHVKITVSDHDHEYDPMHVVEIKLRNAIKRRAAEDTNKPIKLLRTSAAQFPSEVQQKITVNAQRKILARVRSKAKDIPKEPDSLDNFEVPENLRKTIDGDKFLIEDSIEGEHRFIMFASKENLQHLARAKYWIMDGTFSSVSALFGQLFTIHGSCPPDHQHTFPQVYVLMTSKTEELYRRVFQSLIDAGDDIGLTFKPEVILSDYEKAIVNASASEFKESKHNTCFFHLSQNMWKHVQRLGLTNIMTRDSKTFDYFKQMQALAFLPPSKILQAFDMIKSSAPSFMAEFLSYFDENYVNGRIRRTTKDGRVSRNDPLYPPRLWSVYENIINNIPRTTNQIESWHSQWNSIVGRHAGVLKMIEEFRLEEKFVSGQILGYLSANSSKKRKTTSQQNDENISKIVRSLHTMTTKDYLKAIAANLGSKS